jgi:hypothetical protein
MEIYEQKLIKEKLRVGDKKYRRRKEKVSL